MAAPAGDDDDQALQLWSPTPDQIQRATVAVNDPSGMTDNDRANVCQLVGYVATMLQSENAGALHERSYELLALAAQASDVRTAEMAREVLAYASHHANVTVQLAVGALYEDFDRALRECLSERGLEYDNHIRQSEVAGRQYVDTQFTSVFNAAGLEFANVRAEFDLQFAQRTDELSRRNAEIAARLRAETASVRADSMRSASEARDDAVHYAEAVAAASSVDVSTLAAQLRSQHDKLEAQLVHLQKQTGDTRKKDLDNILNLTDNSAKAILEAEKRLRILEADMQTSAGSLKRLANDIDSLKLLIEEVSEACAKRHTNVAVELAACKKEQASTTETVKRLRQSLDRIRDASPPPRVDSIVDAAVDAALRPLLMRVTQLEQEIENSSSRTTRAVDLRFEQIERVMRDDRAHNKSRNAELISEVAALKKLLAAARPPSDVPPSQYSDLAKEVAELQRATPHLADLRKELARVHTAAKDGLIQVECTMKEHANDLQAKLNAVDRRCKAARHATAADSDTEPPPRTQPARAKSAAQSDSSDEEVDVSSDDEDASSRDHNSHRRPATAADCRDEWDALHDIDSWPWRSLTSLRAFLLTVKDLMTLALKQQTRSATSKQLGIDLKYQAMYKEAMRVQGMHGADISFAIKLEIAQMVWLMRASFDEAAHNANWVHLRQYYECWTAENRGLLPQNTQFLKARLKGMKAATKQGGKRNNYNRYKSQKSNKGDGKDGKDAKDGKKGNKSDTD